jgi:hypothetical protein
VPAADDGFVSLAHVLRAPVAEIAEPAEVAVAAPPPQPMALPDAADLARDVRVFRARLADAFDAARDALLHEFAYAVLGRELVLAPADIAVIAARVLAQHADAEPLRLRVAASDAAALAHQAAGLPPLLCDAELAPGDAILEFAGGHVDARLGVRLAALLGNGP